MLYSSIRPDAPQAGILVHGENGRFDRTCVSHHSLSLIFRQRILAVSSRVIVFIAEVTSGAIESIKMMRNILKREFDPP
jgi:hypothetical protein